MYLKNFNHTVAYSFYKYQAIRVKLVTLENIFNSLFHKCWFKTFARDSLEKENHITLEKAKSIWHEQFAIERSQKKTKTGIERFSQEFLPIFTSNWSKMISVRLLYMFCILKRISAFRAFWKTNFHWGSTCLENLIRVNQHLLTKKSTD